MKKNKILWFTFLGIPIIYHLIYLTYKSWKKISYKGKVIVITGASSGIGEQLAIHYAKLGAKLILVARRKDKLDHVVQVCNENGSEAIGIIKDVSKRQDCKNIIEIAIEKFHTIDILVLNAGIGMLIRVDEMNEFDLDYANQIMNTNYWGYIYTTYYALKYLKRSNGTIIVVSSLAAKFNTPERSIYSSSKFALDGFFKCLRNEEPNISVVIVYPGFVLTEMHDKIKTKKEIQREKKQFITAEKAANIILRAGYEKKYEEIMISFYPFISFLQYLCPKLVNYFVKKKASNSLIKK